ncbi:hypothetical protein KEJ33_05680 [Candidatus Bathyarchaeota archaeon]|nr:hypothetical protein [Candidatus Bathyarchaeota archaeon]
MPSQGFRQLMTSSMIDNYNHSLYVSLSREGGWLVQVWFSMGITELVLEHEKIISLKEITGYSGSIVSMPTASSKLYMYITYSILYETTK